MNCTASLVWPPAFKYLEYNIVTVDVLIKEKLRQQENIHSPGDVEYFLYLAMLPPHLSVSLRFLPVKSSYSKEKYCPLDKIQLAYYGHTWSNSELATLLMQHKVKVCISVYSKQQSTVWYRFCKIINIGTQLRLVYTQKNEF